ncbi:dihydrolipoyllysine-residue acetyltransferase [Permianibacter sp. IMCC34836]|uniref:dihydrolipoyllysine-residue acetyltransferase n=1 Tax=Permianibacter fluminis TaxID=2738515 RepID=UPI0015558C6E|nr:dihydrolipoyllysine-residue acetyltransferase [Permianibacter fluminis]NQD37044.1 dihydrolipoyllysine-residue acetyltransferase [Permianibacter fluminis]
MAIREITVPDIGDVKNVDVIEVPVKVGDVIKKDDTLITVETDKATMEVPAPAAGTIKEMKLKVGDKVSQGSLILLLEEAGASAAVSAPAPAPTAVSASAPAPVAAVPAPVAAAPAAASGPARSETVSVPDIGDAKDVDVIEIAVKVGDTVKKDDTLIVVEGEKATMDVPSSVSGVVESIALKVGDKVSKGSVIGVIKVAGGASAPLAAAPAPSTSVAASAPSVVTAAMPSVSTDRAAPVPDYPYERKAVGEKIVHASPAIRRFARELGVDLGKVNASGPKGRVMKEDIQSFVKFELNRPKPVASSGAGVPELPTIDFSKWGEVETRQLTRIQKVSSVNLHRNWLTIPHVTQHDDADITELEAFRQGAKDEAEKRGIKLTPLVFVMKAVVNTLQAFPSFNASLAPDGETLVLKKYWHIGVAVDTPDGLVVPVVRDVDKKSVFQLSEELAEISKKAREKKLGADAMQGSTFTISSLGGIGGSYFTPIVAWPNVAILGLSKSSMKPVWDGKQFVPRLMLPMSLSYDHRVIDGAVGARFITHLAKNLSDIRRLLL